MNFNVLEISENSSCLFRRKKKFLRYSPDLFIFFFTIDNNFLIINLLTLSTFPYHNIFITYREVFYNVAIKKYLFTKIN